MLFLGLRSDSPIAFILLLFHSHADSLYTGKETKSEPNLCGNGKDWRYSDGRLILSYSIAFLDIKVIIIWLSKEKITYSGVGTQRQSIGFITRTISAYLKLYTGLCCVLSLELFEKSFQPTTISPRTLNLFITFPTASQLDYASKGKSWALFRNFPTYSTVGRDFPERRLEFRYEKKAFRCHPLSYRVVALDMCTHKTYTYDL